MLQTFVVNSQCNKIHSYLTVNHRLEDGYVGKQPVAWKECFAVKENSGKACISILDVAIQLK